MLLEARKLPLAERAAARYFRFLLRRAFARVWLGGVPFPDGPAPSIAFLNHSAWWDPILTQFLSWSVLERDAYGLFRGEELQRYPFFRRLGCFGITTERLDDLRALPPYAASLLTDAPRRTLWVLPQSELLPARIPLMFRSMLARTARLLPEVPLVPVAVRYEFRLDQRAECFVRVGEATYAQPNETAATLTRRLEQRLKQELALLDADLAQPGVRQFRLVLEGLGSLSALYDHTFGRIQYLRRNA
ncbi:MAG TPA: lysophospholipid acyltransferase family protein [Gemmatimonadaceae bacterium]|jgi:1-acyl-sn-glycerol-3-phosphate acyltransferase|nr:lysophospholipid acyltransferase family protein [Gemmatimonadaceae bacterium]